MGFKEYFLEYELRQIKQIMVNPIVPTAIPKSGLRSKIGPAKLSIWKPIKYKSPFRKGESTLKSR